MTTANTNPIYITVRQASQSIQVSPEWLYRAIARGEVPGSRRFGRSVRLNADAFREWAQRAEQAR
jgi:excisionase family DNA binding protein